MPRTSNGGINPPLRIKCRHHLEACLARSPPRRRGALVAALADRWCWRGGAVPPFQPRGRQALGDQLRYFREQLERTRNIAKVEIQGTEGAGRIRQPAARPQRQEGPATARSLPLEKKFVTTLPLPALADHDLDELLREKLGDDYAVSRAERQHAAR